MYTFAGEVRLGITGPLYLIGAGASSTNTVEPGMVCVSKNNEEDTVKEGTTLSVLRLNSSEMAVKIGCRQALFIETANDGSSYNFITWTIVAILTEIVFAYYRGCFCVLLH